MFQWLRKLSTDEVTDYRRLPLPLHLREIEGKPAMLLPRKASKCEVCGVLYIQTGSTLTPDNPENFRCGSSKCQERASDAKKAAKVSRFDRVRRR